MERGQQGKDQGERLAGDNVHEAVGCIPCDMSVRDVANMRRIMSSSSEEQKLPFAHLFKKTGTKLAAVEQPDAGTSYNP